MADLVTEWFMEPSVRTNYRTMVYYKGDGQDTFEINFDGGFIYKEDVKAFSVKDDTRERKNHKVTFVNGSVSRVKLDSAIPKGWTVCIYRDTPKAKPLAQFTDGAIINEANLDRNAQQAMFAVSEMVDRFDSTVESVEAALQQVYEANKKADQAINTANGAKATADSAVRIANGAVTTANEAKQSAANANTTANGAVKTANEAKSIAQGLDGQIKQANTTANNAVNKADSAIATANEAKATANGIDAKATKALADSAQALKVANGIDGKATQALNNSKEALDKANAALQSQGIAKELTDRVEGYPTSIDVRWKGNHVFQQGITFNKDNDAGARGVVELWNEKELRFGARIGGNWSVARFVVEEGELYLPVGKVYRVGSLNPDFGYSVITRNTGYYSRYRMINSTNNDTVELIHGPDNRPYLESRSGSNGAIQSQWYFPYQGGNVLTDKYWHRFAQGASETNMFSPDKQTYFNIRNDRAGVYNAGASRWNYMYTMNAFKVFGRSTYTGLELTRGNGTYLRLETNEDFLTIVQRNANDTNNGVVAFPKPTLSSDTVVYSSMVYGKDQVYTKAQSDANYIKRREPIKSVKGNWDVGSTLTIPTDLRGKVITLQRPYYGENENGIASMVCPLVSGLQELNDADGGAYWWLRFTYTESSTTIKIVSGHYARLDAIYYRDA
ncbi:tail fiber protein [Salmonella phage vB_SpuP_Spp16]|uniref:Tail fiber protein n=1 Tax=Salmonella phage vB_SpuP_Spp16 TaxID=2081603 RepID=A0A2P9JZV0_9CAUD|nr:tail fiber protein [Salmonella phage vB_SpuP_Spp16]AVI05068.1 tail fiber protein [Salmonella phage vB_SpuP_Spp16]